MTPDGNRPVVIEVEGATKTFVQRRRAARRRLRRERLDLHAVHDVSFTVQAGEMVGYLGPNGAGKSTTIKMLIGILTPTAGRLRVAGLDPARQRLALARRIGVVFGQTTPRHSASSSVSWRRSSRQVQARGSSSIASKSSANTRGAQPATWKRAG
ncbi:ATP-binding cassette domain-containing protein [Pseudofrankia sp. DC12]|uniref:ATP-binding cassette domain-containing protein n=1 Tax=Pseudofrankia sp. DC12 TaxID=683315 RepID=UPI0009FE5465|nr:ATP-binding cassette domain-containing protein [Pseudofrankia sp. DC12]